MLHLFSRLRLLAVMTIAIGFFAFNPPPSEAQITDCTGVTGIPASECAVLLDIYTSLNGDGWTYHFGANPWFSTFPNACEWAGINCSGGHVTQIEMINYVGSEQGNFPSDLTPLPQLQFFGVDDDYRGTITLNISDMLFPTSLERISIWIDYLVGNINNINALPNLRMLSLESSNQLIGNLSDFAFPTNLEFLNLKSEYITGNIDEVSFPNTLIEIVLDLGNIRGNIASVVWPPELLYLNIHNAPITGDITSIAWPPGLRSVRLNETQVTGNIANLVWPDTLNFAELNHTNISGDVAALSSWPQSLSSVRLAHTNIGGVFDFRQGDLPFNSLEISCTNIVPADAEAEAYLNQLRPQDHPNWRNEPWNLCTTASLESESAFEPTYPLNNNPIDTRAHGYGMEDAVYGTMHMENGAWQYNAGGVPQELIDYGVLMAVDVWEQGGDQVFETYQRVCVQGEGRMIFMDATQSPRTMTEILPVDYEDGYTCGWIPNAGTVIIIEPEA